MSLKIGIVDDNALVRQALRVWIESNTEWQVCGEAENGEDAIGLVQRENPDALILDVLMPKMNGLDAARKISAISSKTAVVLFTSYPSEHLLKEATRLGIRSVVSKDETGALLHLRAALKEATSASHAAASSS